MIILGLAAALFGSGAATVFLVDDFSRENASALGTKWQTFTDRVMGGVSDGQASFETLAGKRCLRLKGTVSLENQGGFVQAALPLVKQGGSFDAATYRGIRLWVRGERRHLLCPSAHGGHAPALAVLRGRVRGGSGLETGRRPLLRLWPGEPGRGPRSRAT